MGKLSALLVALVALAMLPATVCEGARMSAPVDIEVTRPMTASRDALWAVLSDLSRVPEWLEFAAELPERSSDRADAGATYTVRPPRRMEPTTHWRIAEVDEGSRQLHTSEMPMFSGVRSEIAIEDAPGGGVQVHVRWRAQKAKLVARLLHSSFEKRIRDNWERSLARLDEVALRRSSPSA